MGQYVEDRQYTSVYEKHLQGCWPYPPGLLSGTGGGVAVKTLRLMLLIPRLRFLHFTAGAVKPAGLGGADAAPDCWPRLKENISRGGV